VDEGMLGHFLDLNFDAEGTNAALLEGAERQIGEARRLAEDADRRRRRPR